MAETIIISAEEKYRAVLEEYCRQLFSGVMIPSHDHLHHARVWAYSKEILKNLIGSGMIDDPTIADKAIIAAFFHDTGLTVNTGPAHGRESRKICHEFLIKQKIDPEFHDEILDAVEKHDDKDYAAGSDPATLPAIIAVADDMDAFGHIGVLRYWEIYSMRGIAVTEMPALIIKNARNRFRHLEATYNMFPELVAHHKERLEILVDFYNSLQNSL
jgi:HD superfamily phosphodiesterase